MAATKTDKPIKAPAKQSPPIYLVTLRGRYMNGNTENGQSGFKNYEIEVKMTEEMAEFSPLSVFFNNCKDLMPTKYPDFRGIETHYVVRTRRSDNKPITNIHLLNRAELEQIIINEGMKINTGAYKEAEDLKAAIFAYTNDERGFQRAQQIVTLRARGAEQFKSAFMALNDATGIIEDDAAHNVPAMHEVIKTEKDRKKKEKLREKQMRKKLETDDTDEEEDDYDSDQGTKLMKDKLEDDDYLDGAPKFGGKKREDLVGL